MSSANDFMMALANRFVTEKGLTESTAHQYIQTLTTLNGKKPFKSLAFLKKLDSVKPILDSLAVSTRLSAVGTALSALELFDKVKGYKAAFQQWQNLLSDVKETKAETQPPGSMTEKQSENYISWNDVMVKQQELRESAKAIKGRTVTSPQYFTLLRNMLLSLYTSLPPRRNKDFSDMMVVKKWNNGMTTEKNYLDLSGKQFIFNQYKTAKTYGQNIVTIPEQLFEDIQMYLKHNPLKKEKEYPFLVYQDGKALNNVNGITRELNRLFAPKKIGSSMLRHIFITSKYGPGSEAEAIEKERAETAAGMAHSVSQQGGYIFTHNPSGEPFPEPPPSPAGGAGEARKLDKPARAKRAPKAK